MTWHLKDRELEKKLIAIDPEFIDKLQMTKGYGNYGFYLNLGGYVYSGDCGVPKIQIYLVPEDLDEVPEYNPKIWNDSRKVTPPENVIFMAKLHETNLDEEDTVYYKVLSYKDSKWYYVMNGKPSDCKAHLDEGDYVEFKSWED